MKINGAEVPEDIHKFIQIAVVHYLEETEQTSIGARIRRDEVLLKFLLHNDIETIRSRFYLETINIRCPKCNELVDNQDPDMICWNCNQVIDHVPNIAHAYDFCKETCTDTSLSHCDRYQKLKSHIEEK